jgi:hypothetical protein
MFEHTNKENAIQRQMGCRWGTQLANRTPCGAAKLSNQQQRMVLYDASLVAETTANSIIIMKIGAQYELNRLWTIAP